MTLADVRFAWFRWSPGLLLSMKIPLGGLLLADLAREYGFTVGSCAGLRVLGEALEFQVRLLGEA